MAVGIAAGLGRAWASVLRLGDAALGLAPGARVAVVDKLCEVQELWEEEASAALGVEGDLTDPPPSPSLLPSIGLNLNSKPSYPPSA